MIKCPECSTRMNETFSFGGVIVDHCPSCSGTWLDEGEINFMVKEPDKVRQALQKGLINPHSSSRNCPRCEVPMIEGGLVEEALQIDECPSCKGLFFDGHELDQLNTLLAKGGFSPERKAPVFGAQAQTTDAYVSEPLFPEPVERVKKALVSPLAMASLPSLAVRAGGVLIGLYGILFGVTVFLAEYYNLSTSTIIPFYLGFIIINYLISPWIMDLSLRWLQGMRWVKSEELPEHLKMFLMKLCSSKNVPLPKIGIIYDGNPNAFTYGRTPRDARIIFTEGLIDILSPDELEAVAAHEMGHVIHWDMLVMTVASMVPVILYSLYRQAARAARFAGRSRDGAKARGAALSAAVTAYLAYIITQYLLLFLSRVREYHADRFAGEVTDNPDALSTALVKIAYGLAGRGSGEKSSERQDPSLSPAQAFGIFNPRTARALAASSLRGKTFDRAAMMGAMQWDLWNPWAAFYELNSTHPLPAKRIEMLSNQSEAMGYEPVVRFNLTKPESYWDEFFVDLFYLAAPFIGALIGFLAGGATTDSDTAIAAAFTGLGIGMFMRTVYSYRNPSGFLPVKVSSLTKIIKVSGVRAVPVRLKGKIIGKGVPGHIMSEDLVLQDETGFIFLDYRQPLKFLEFLFGIFRAGGIVGQQVEVLGYYRRSPMPYVEMISLNAGGSEHNCHVRTFKYIISMGITVLGVMMLLTL